MVWEALALWPPPLPAWWLHKRMGYNVVYFGSWYYRYGSMGIEGYKLCENGPMPHMVNFIQFVDANFECEILKIVV